MIASKVIINIEDIGKQRFRWTENSNKATFTWAFMNKMEFFSTCHAETRRARLKMPRHAMPPRAQFRQFFGSKGTHTHIHARGTLTVLWVRHSAIVVLFYRVFLHLLRELADSFVKYMEANIETPHVSWYNEYGGEYWEERQKTGRKRERAQKMRCIKLIVRVLKNRSHEKLGEKIHLSKHVFGSFTRKCFNNVHDSNFNCNFVTRNTKFYKIFFYLQKMVCL